MTNYFNYSDFYISFNIGTNCPEKCLHKLDTIEKNTKIIIDNMKQLNV